LTPPKNVKEGYDPLEVPWHITAASMHIITNAILRDSNVILRDSNINCLFFEHFIMITGSGLL
jgi:hypothetical protein